MVRDIGISCISNESEGAGHIMYDHDKPSSQPESTPKEMFRKSKDHVSDDGASFLVLTSSGLRRHCF